MNIFLSAGEASGDHYGAELITALRQTLPQARFTGLGGTQMEAAGQHRIIRAEDVAVMGITEILRHIPTILRSYLKLVASIKKQRPEVAILIDFPDVNFRLARHLHRAGVPVIWFVSPQLWAWKRSRLRWVQQRVSTMLVIFPFEEVFYRNRGVTAEFVGHPLAEQPLPTISRLDFATAHHLDPAKPWIALLPGSRASEIHRHLTTMLDAAQLLGPQYEFLVPIASGIGDQQRSAMQSDTRTGANIVFVQDARAALLHSRAALIASGTATVQAAVLGTPFVCIYRVSRLTFAAVRRLVRYPAEIPAQPDEHGNLPICMVNLIAGSRVVPELLQQNFTAQHTAAALLPLLDSDSAIRKLQLNALAQVREKLHPPANRTAIQRLRDTVLQALSSTKPAPASKL